jgi:hypothetical protein
MLVARYFTSTETGAVYPLLALAVRFAARTHQVPGAGSSSVCAAP